MVAKPPLVGDSIQSTNDAGSLASRSLDGINQLRDESLGAGQSSKSFLQLVRDVQGAGPAKKGPGASSVFENIGSPYEGLKQSSQENKGVTDNFGNLSVTHVGGHRSHIGSADTGKVDNKTSATVYGDGSVQVELTDGQTVNADANSGQISLSSDNGTFTSDGSGNYYFTDSSGRKQLIDAENAQELGAELKDGALTVGRYRFEEDRLSLADGSSIRVGQGRVHAHFKHGDGENGDVQIEARAGESVVSSDGGAQSFVSGNDVFTVDRKGLMQHTKLAGDAADKSTPLGGVPIRDAMSTLFSLADSVRGKSVISPAEYSALQAAVTQLNSASVACKDLHNWTELRFIHNISSAVDRFLAHVSPGTEPGSATPLRNSELTESIAEPNQAGNRNLPDSPSYLPRLRFDVPGGTWADVRTNEPPAAKVRFDNPGMVSDAAVSEASKVLPVEKV